MMGDHQERFKAGATADIAELRRRKTEQSVELRKQKRSERMQEKRRNTTEEALEMMIPIAHRNLPMPTLDQLPDLVTKLHADHLEDIQIGAHQIRRCDFAFATVLFSSSSCPFTIASKFLNVVLYYISVSHIVF
eukprot:Awhi_evm1s13605